MAQKTGGKDIMKNKGIQSMKIDSNGNEWYLVKNKTLEWPNGQPCKLVYADRYSTLHLVERFNEDGLMIASGIV